MRPDHGHSSTCISCMQGSLINSKSLLCRKPCSFKKNLLFQGLANRLYYEIVDRGRTMGLNSIFNHLFFPPNKAHVTCQLDNTNRKITKMSIKMQRWNASHCLFIIAVNHKIAVKPARICTSNSLHTEGLFFSLCSPSLVLLLLNLSRRVYRRWITLHFHSESWRKKKRLVCGGILLPFPWMSLSGSHIQISVRFTHCLRLLVPEVFPGAGWPVGVRASGCFFFFFFALSPGRSGCWERSVAACRNTTRYWLNNLCHLIVMWLTPAPCCQLHSFHHSLGKVEASHIEMKSRICLLKNESLLCFCMFLISQCVFIALWKICIYYNFPLGLYLLYLSTSHPLLLFLYIYFLYLNVPRKCCLTIKYLTVKGLNNKDVEPQPSKVEPEFGCVASQGDSGFSDFLLTNESKPSYWYFVVWITILLFFDWNLFRQSSCTVPLCSD